MTIYLKSEKNLMKAGCPNLIERAESGLLSYGNDMDLYDNPFECGFDHCKPRLGCKFW